MHTIMYAQAHRYMHACSITLPLVPRPYLLYMLTFEPPETQAKGRPENNHGTAYAMSLLPKAIGGHTCTYPNSGIVALVKCVSKPFLLLRKLVLTFEFKAPDIIVPRVL